MLVLALAATGVTAAWAEQRPGNWAFSDRARFVWGPGALSGVLGRAERSAWQPGVNDERDRGGADLYARVAPAVVVVRTESGHGSGFFVGSDRRILTNHHVIAEGLRHDTKRMASYALVHLGRLASDGSMELRSDPVRAYLLKHDADVDLALLQLDARPEGFGSAAPLQLADQAARPGSPATIVGHPAAGMLWTLRSGEVAAMGRMPADLVDIVMYQLASTAAQRAEMAAQLDRQPSSRIILTSTGANPGDSGGPVVDSAGRVIAVTFAIPPNPAQAKFSYHVHLDEVRRFLAAVPGSPMLMVPDAWEIGAKADVRDVDGDRIPDLMLAGTEYPDRLLLDLDENTPAAVSADVEKMVRDRAWDFEFALHDIQSASTAAAFYDTDNRDGIDLVHVVYRGGPDRNYSFSRASNGSWRVAENTAIEFPSARYLTDPRIAQRLAVFLEQMRSGGEEEEGPERRE